MGIYKSLFKIQFVKKSGNCQDEYFRKLEIFLVKNIYVLF